VWFQTFEEYIRRNFEDDIRDKEHGQGGIEFDILQIEVLDKPKRFGVGDIDTIKKGKEVEMLDKGLFIPQIRI